MKKVTLDWVNGDNNWNQVCNGGMIAASIAIAEKDPDTGCKDYQQVAGRNARCSEAICSQLEYILKDATYWDYGTSFSVITSSMLQSAFGTDFGLADYPSFLESANFRMLTVAPSGGISILPIAATGQGSMAILFLHGSPENR